jgi:hypothetical protein
MKFEHKDILILGDSFCRDRGCTNDWPFIVSQSLTSSTEKLVDMDSAELLGGVYANDY